MTEANDLVRRYSLPIYFTLTFVVSWAAVLTLAGADGLPATEDQAVALGIAMLLGPSTAGILMTGIVSGRAGFCELLSRLLRWRASARWYAVALFTAPLSTGTVLLALSLVSPEYTPHILVSDDKGALILMGSFAGIPVGLLEELGWTGFATPRLGLRHGTL